MNTDLLRLEDLRKEYPGTVALDGVSLQLKKGEVRGLIGENGAGKSTLVNILSGIVQKDGGKVFLDGKEVNIKHPQNAKDLGIVTIYQELTVIPNLSAAENIFIKNEPTRGRILLDKKRLFAQADRSLRDLGVDIRSSTLAGELSVAQRQMVEIARALAGNARIIIMDEPTSSLTENEIALLKNIIRSLKQRDVSVIFVTHKLNEIIEITDSASVLRDGRLVETVDRSTFNVDSLIRLMVGKKLDDFYVKSKRGSGEVVLKVSNLTTPFLKEINFEVRRGEVLGLAGPVGSGRTEIMRAIFGIDRIEKGEVRMFGKKVFTRSAYEAIRAGIGYIPEDRKLQGLVLEMAISQNLTLPIMQEVSTAGFIDRKREEEVVAGFIKKFSIKTTGFKQKARYLSGGNQQKVVLSKWLAIKPQVLLLDEPTRGIDVATKQEIYNIIGELANMGISMIIASSELEETIQMSDRIIVLYQGKQMGELSREEATQETVLKLVNV